MNTNARMAVNWHGSPLSALRRLFPRATGLAARDLVSGGTASRCARLIESIVAGLRELNQTTEADFLVIGSKLMAVLTLTRKISSEMDALREMVSGQRQKDHATLLLDMLERTRQAEMRTANGEVALAAVSEVAQRIGREFDKFEKTVAMFNVLGSLTRIETARLGAGGREFGTLAEAVHTLSVHIQESAQTVFRASEVLHKNMQSALAKVARLRESELRELPSLTAELVASLESIEERQRRAGEAAQRQAAEYAEISAAIEDIISAIQFHDITRQQVEHVSNSLKQSGEGIVERGSRVCSLPADLKKILQLQGLQLSHAEQVFLSSTGRIENSLARIASRAAGMVEVSKTLLGLTADEHDSFFHQMEGRFADMLRIAGACANAERASHAMLQEIEENVTKMRQSVESVCLIELRIRRIAINAIVRAEQIGGSGKALGVLAGVMQVLAADTYKLTREVSLHLDSISNFGAQLCHSDSKAESEFSQGLQGTIADLHSSGQDSFRKLGEIVAHSATLCSEIQSATSGFHARQQFSDCVDCVRAEMEHLGQALPSGEDAATNAGLLALQKQYTMQIERDIHHAACGGAPQEAPTGATETVAVMTEEELGDNVELF